MPMAQSEGKTCMDAKEQEALAEEICSLEGKEVVVPVRANQVH